MKSKDIINKIINNWPAKVISVIAAIMLCLFAQISMLKKRSISVPLEVKISGNLTFSDKIPKYIRVTLRGDENEIALLQERDFQAYIDTSEVTTEGFYRLPIQLDLSKNVTMVEHLEIQISPETIPLTLEKKITDLLPIEANIYGSCMEGYEIASIQIEPDKIQITGTEKQIAAQSILETDVINVDQKKASFSVDVNVNNTNSMLSLTGNNKVKISFEIKPINSEKSYESSIIFFNGLESTLKVENPSIPYVLNINGVKTLVDSFVLSPLTVQVDCSHIVEPGEYSVPLIVQVPPDINVVSITPSTINITVGKLTEILLEQEQNDSLKQDVVPTEQDTQVEE